MFLTTYIHTVHTCAHTCCIKNYSVHCVASVVQLTGWRNYKNHNITWLQCIQFLYTCTVWCTAYTHWVLYIRVPKQPSKYWFLGKKQERCNDLNPTWLDNIFSIYIKNTWRFFTRWRHRAMKLCEFNTYTFNCIK